MTSKFVFRIACAAALTTGAALFVSACDTAPPASDTSLSEGDKPSEPRARVTDARETQAVVFREVTIPAGTRLTLRLTSAVASDTSRAEDPIGAELIGPVTVDGRDVVPAGSSVTGIVMGAERPGRVKGRGSVTLAFNSLHTAGRRYDIRTEPVSRIAPATKGEDAAKIGVGAGAGAAVGAIVGGKKGAAEGAAIGGGAGTGVVLATRGREVRLAPGAQISTELTAPLRVRVG